MTTLERHYRLLLHCYPSHFRKRFMEEIVGTLMEAAPPGQRFPRPKEGFNLIWNALRARFSLSGLPSGVDRHWADAASVSGLVGSFLMFASLAIWLVAEVAFEIRLPGEHRIGAMHLPWAEFALGIGWLVIAAVALTGRWGAAAIGGWLIASSYLVLFLSGYHNDSTVFIRNGAFMVGSITVAACLSVPAPPHQARKVLGNRLTWIICGGLAFIPITGYLDSLLVRVMVHETGGFTVDGAYGTYFDLPGLPDGPIGRITAALCLGILVWGFARSGRVLRRRFAAIVLPVFVLSVVMRLGYQAVEQSSVRFWAAGVLVAGQWLVLVLVPSATFLIGWLLVRRADERDELMELGRAELARTKESEPA